MAFQMNSERAEYWNKMNVAAARKPRSPGEYLTIGDMSRNFGVSLRALRFYEDRGLMQPQRHGQTRLYDGRQRQRLQMILKGKQLGFTLTEIREMIASQGQSEPDEFENTLDTRLVANQIEHLERQRSGLDMAIRELRDTHARLANAAEQGTAAAS